MKPYEGEYRRLKERATVAAKNPEQRDEVLREIAKHVIAELRLFGLSDGALCAWAELKGYESFNDELSRYDESGRHQALMKRMWALAKHAGVTHEKSGARRGTHWWRITSEAMRKANQSEVWKATREFREAFERSKKEKECAALEAKHAQLKIAAPPKMKLFLVHAKGFETLVAPLELLYGRLVWGSVLEIKATTISDEHFEVIRKSQS